MLLEAKSVQQFMSKKKQINFLTSKISTAIRSLTEEAKGGVFSLTDKICSKTELDLSIDFFHDVVLKHHIQPLQRETIALKSITIDDHARLDIKDNKNWQLMFNKTYFGVKIFDLLSKTFPESSSKATKIKNL